MKRFKGCLGVFGIFLFGVIFGVAITAGAIHEEVRKLVEGGPDKVVDVVVNRLRKDLHLDENQQEMLQHIAVETRIKLGAIRQQTQPKVAQTLDEAVESVRGILNPNQIKKFDEIIGKTRARWKVEQVGATPKIEVPNVVAKPEAGP